jgi:hypothetical protein
MRIARKLRRVAAGLDLLQIGNTAGQAGILLWMWTASAVPLLILSPISVLPIATGFLCCCLGPSLLLRCVAGTSLGLLLGTVTLHLLQPGWFADLPLPGRVVIASSPLLGMLLFLGALTGYCRRLQPGEGRWVVRYLLVWGVTAGFVGLTVLLAAGSQPVTWRFTGMFVGIAAIHLLALFKAIGAAGAMANRVAGGLGGEEW